MTKEGRKAEERAFELRISTFFRHFDFVICHS